MRAFDQLPLVSLSDIVASHARFASSKTAVVCGETRLSWSELDQRVTLVANGLIAGGIRPGDKVALVTANSAEMIEILLGINRAGAVMVPLSLLAPGEAQARMLEDSGSKALFVSSGFDQVVGPHIAENALLEGRRFAIGFDSAGWQRYHDWRDAQSSDRPAIRRELGDECIIIYSSGTTGTPKGIVHTHYNRQLFALAVSLEFRFTGECVALATTPLYSNGTWLMFLPALLVQAPLVVMTKFDAGTFLELVERERVTHTLMVPPQYAAVLNHAKLATTDLSSFRVLSSAGSTLRADVKRRVMAEMAPVLLELYGLTEGIGTVLRPEDVLRKTDSVGMPLFGTDIRIIDPAGNELQRGEVGEIIGYASGLMKGYHNRPEASSDVVWLAPDGRTFLKTGDIGKLDEEGFVGSSRVDLQACKLEYSIVSPK